MIEAVFAIPGDKNRRTGGFIYEATVLQTLNDIGVMTAHLELPDCFPHPSVHDMEKTLAELRQVPHEQPIILDGLVLGAIDPDGLATVRAPIIGMIHHPLGLETGLTPSRAAYLCANEAAVLKHVAHVIVPSPHTARVLVNDFGVDQNRISVALPGFTRPQLRKVKSNPPLILSVGLLAERKGHDVLLNALSLIKNLHWQAIIVGNAHEPDIAQALQVQCADLGLSARVTFAGEIDAHELDTLFNRAHLFALATRYEGYGMVLSEAMLYGLPIISCDAGAVADTVGSAGILTPPDDAAQFAQSLRTLLETPHTLEHYAALSQARAQDLPTWAMTARVFEEVIAQVKLQTT